MKSLVALLGLQACLAVFPPSDQVILNNLWASTGKWERGGNGDACTWTRIQCGLITEIVGIDLSNMGLYGPFAFTGTLASLIYLDISNNFFTGNITAVFANTPVLQVGRFAGNLFTGALSILPPGLKQLDIGSSQLALDVGSVTFPASLQYLNLQGSSTVVGTFNPAFADNDWIEIRVSNLNLGNLTMTLLSKPKLVVAEIPATGFNGQFPRALPATLKVLDMRNNNIKGNLSWNVFYRSWNSGSSLTVLDLSGNQLSDLTDLPAADATHQEDMRTLRLANNKFKFDVSVVLQALKQLPRLVVLDISGNSIYGDVASFMANVKTTNVIQYVFSVEPRTPLFADLLIFNASHNNLTGPIPILSAFQDLNTVDMSHNALTGPLPFSLAHSSLRALHFRDNRLKAAAPPDSVPPYVRLDGQHITEDKANHLICATVTPAVGMTVEVDWLTYFEIADFCDCEENYVYSTSRMQCVPCPLHTLCSVDIQDIAANATPTSSQRLGAVRRGFYPVGPDGLLSAEDPGGPNRPVLARCRHDELCNPTQPQPEGAFSCADGHDITSLLCSRCNPDHFSVLDVCYECTAGAILSPIVTIIFLIILTLTVLRKQTKDGFEAGTVQIVLTWVQVTRILSEVHTNREKAGPLGGDMVFPALYSISVLSPISIECTLGYVDYQTNLMLVFFAPLMFFVYAGLVALIAVSVLKACCKRQSPPPDTADDTGDVAPSCVQNWLSRTIFLWGFCLYAFYFQFCLVMLRALSCEDLASDPLVDRTAFPRPDYTLFVLTHAPHVRCDQDLDIKPLGAFGVVFALLMPPLVVGLVMLFKQRNPKSWKQDLYPYLGFLTRHLRSEAFLWDMTMVPLRKLLLAVAIACYPRQGAGAIYMPLHVIGVLMVCVLAQSWVRPYKAWFDNALEMFLLAEQLLAFFLVVLTAVGEKFFGASDLSGVEAFVVFMTWATTAVCLMAVFRPMVGQCLGKSRHEIDLAQTNQDVATTEENSPDPSPRVTQAGDIEMAGSHAREA